MAWPGFLISGQIFLLVCVCVCGLALLLVCVYVCGFVAGLMFVFVCVDVVMSLDRLIGVS